MATPLPKLRQSRGLSQEDLARLAGVAKKTVSDLELHHRQARPSTRRKLAKALKVKPQEIDFEATALGRGLGA